MPRALWFWLIIILKPPTSFLHQPPPLIPSSMYPFHPSIRPEVSHLLFNKPKMRRQKNSPVTIQQPKRKSNMLSFSFLFSILKHIKKWTYQPLSAFLLYSDWVALILIDTRLDFKCANRYYTYLDLKDSFTQVYWETVAGIEDGHVRAWAGYKLKLISSVSFHFLNWFPFSQLEPHKSNLDTGTDLDDLDTMWQMSLLCPMNECRGLAKFHLSGTGFIDILGLLHSIYTACMNVHRACQFRWVVLVILISTASTVHNPSQLPIFLILWISSLSCNH